MVCYPLLFCNKSNPPCTGLDKPWGFQDVEAPRFTENRHKNVVRFSVLPFYFRLLKRFTSNLILFFGCWTLVKMRFVASVSEKKLPSFSKSKWLWYARYQPWRLRQHIPLNNGNTALTHNVNSNKHSVCLLLGSFSPLFVFLFWTKWDAFVKLTLPPYSSKSIQLLLHIYRKSTTAKRTSEVG